MPHLCHAKNCKVPVKPEMLMCRMHWFMVPKAIRDRVWAHYRPGQCDDKHPSKEWMNAADDAIRAVFQKEHGICMICKTKLDKGKCSNLDCGSES